ncbi:hypothetical protein KC19_4G257800 [Ceratodon purpureus]|uniref:Uncharacterized protein n=1 Tax=Ceratodon purpureus TaxID=3225 RepID=A0A8T0IF30_CERPU|nr:hypothetical protein KC19_4G257800 [Ceratodon purpureus]
MEERSLSLTKFLKNDEFYHPWSVCMQNTSTIYKNKNQSCIHHQIKSCGPLFLSATNFMADCEPKLGLHNGFLMQGEKTELLT